MAIVVPFVQLISRVLERPKRPAGPVVRLFFLDWSETNEYIIDMSNADKEWEFLCNSMKVNNLSNANAVTLTQPVNANFGDAWQVSAGKIEMLPAVAIVPFHLTIASTQVAGSSSVLSLYNYPQSAIVAA